MKRKALAHNSVTVSSTSRDVLSKLSRQAEIDIIHQIGVQSGMTGRSPRPGSTSTGSPMPVARVGRGRQ
jgi:hypothetical protein